MAGGFRAGLFWQEHLSLICESFESIEAIEFQRPSTCIINYYVVRRRTETQHKCDDYWENTSKYTTERLFPAIADSSVFANVIKVGKVSVSGEPIYGRKGTRHFLKIYSSLGKMLVTQTGNPANMSSRSCYEFEHFIITTDCALWRHLWSELCGSRPFSKQTWVGSQLRTNDECRL